MCCILVGTTVSPYRVVGEGNGRNMVKGSTHPELLLLHASSSVLALLFASITRLWSRVREQTPLCDKRNLNHSFL
jgi:hypothetical protein